MKGITADGIADHYAEAEFNIGKRGRETRGGS